MGTSITMNEGQTSHMEGENAILGWSININQSITLQFLPIYYMSLFPVPKGVIDSIIKIQRQFLWNGDNEKKLFPLISWQVMELSKQIGGLGIGNILNRNISLLFKWWWRYLTDPQALWRKVILLKYGYFPPTSLNDFIIPTKGGPWKDICSSILQKSNVKTLILSCVRKGVGDGSSTLFWHDLWVGDSTLKALYPRLCLLTLNPNSTVATMGFWDGLIWTWTMTWRRDLRSRDLDELDSLMGTLIESHLIQGTKISSYGRPTNRVFSPSNRYLRNLTRIPRISRQSI